MTDLKGLHQGKKATLGVSLPNGPQTPNSHFCIYTL